jgi:hypothetical protein
MDRPAAQGLRFNRSAGPFEHWAHGIGFDYFYGFNAGEQP